MNFMNLNYLLNFIILILYSLFSLIKENSIIKYSKILAIFSFIVSNNEFNFIINSTINSAINSLEDK